MTTLASCKLVPICELKNVNELNRYYHFKHVKMIASLNRDKDGNILSNEIVSSDNEDISLKKNNFSVLIEPEQDMKVNVKEKKDDKSDKKTLKIEQFKVPDQNINLFQDVNKYAYKLDELNIPDLINRLNHIKYKTSSCDFMIFSKTLMRFMEAPYVKQPWKFKVNKFGKTIYIFNEGDDHLTPEQKKFCYSTNKFKYMCKEDPTGNEYNIITYTKLNRHKIILCSRIECVQSDGNYIQVKTTKELTNEKLEKSFVKSKLIKYWLLSKLSSIDLTIVAFRNDDGDIKGIATLRTNKMEDFIQKPYVWSTKVCFNFANKILNMLKKNVNDWDDYYLSYEYPYEGVKLTKG